MSKKIDKLIYMLEKSNLTEISAVLGNRRKLFFSNFFAGVFRGVGFSLGFSAISALIIIILQKIVLLNIPVIGEYINDIIEILKINININ